MKIQTALQKQRISSPKSGFTLVEILIVIALIALLASAAIGGLGGIFGGQQEKTARIFVEQSVKIPLVAYRLDVGNYPTTEEGLNALAKAPASKEKKWKGPYLEKAIEPDPWGNEYKYRFPGSKNINGARGYDVWSLGPDGVESADDIGNW